METKAIVEGALPQQASEHGGRSVENLQQGKQFAQLLHELLGERSPAGMHGAVNPMDFAPAPVGTEILPHMPDEVRQVEHKEEDLPQEEIEVEGKEVDQEEVEQEVVVQEEQVVEVIEAVEEVIEAVQEVEEAALEAVAQTEGMVQEEVQKESGSGQGTPETSLTQDVKTEVVDRTRVIGGEGQIASDNSAGKQTLEQNQVRQERAKVDMGLPKELEAQAAELQEGAFKESQDVKQFVRAKIELPANGPREVGKEASAEGAEALPEFTMPVIDSVLKNMDLSKGGKAENSLRYQLGSLLRPDLGAEALTQNAGGRTGTLMGSGSVAGANASGGAEKQAVNAKRAKESTLPQSKQNEIIDRVKDMLKNASATKNGNTMVVRLDPPKLGAMTVRVTHKAGQVFARIIPESQEVENVLRGRLAELTQAMANIGVKPENIHISLGQERSESEMYQFNEFLNQQGGQGEKEDGLSQQGDGTSATISPSGGGGGAENAPQESGWVA